MKIRLEAEDVKIVQKCLSTAVCSNEQQQALHEIMAKAEAGIEFDTEMSDHIANTCRDIALSLEASDLYCAQQLMSLALAIRPSGPLLQKKTHEYAKLLQVFESGSTECNGIKLAFGENLPLPLLKALANGSYEQHEAKLLMQFIGPEDRVLELGAGIGYMGSLAMTYCKPLTYTAYEANPALLPLIMSNMERNRVQFEARNTLLADTKASRDFYVTPAFWASSLLEPDSEPYQKVTVAAVDKNVVMDELKPTALVVDIEGGEAEFFAGLDLTTVNKIIIEIHPAVLDDATLSTLYASLLNKGFKLNFSASSKVVLYWYR
ncbi:FkbM family methyltransferase [Oceanisphaera sp. IT1-181]|uniref:FkbM family methyltransferase n=1 Tax=Oceanisphaera sp. IT1-181 TaxID=3081199 RepID=UPI0029CA3C81|nr:FkbM family methyltransferase [Oceanisphaera sp. IT1-181]